MGFVAERNSANVRHSNGHTGRGIDQIISLLYWSPRYEISWLTADVVAGITLAAYAIPVSMAYASDNELISNVVVFRFEASLLYFVNWCGP